MDKTVRSSVNEVRDRTEAPPRVANDLKEMTWTATT